MIDITGIVVGASGGIGLETTRLFLSTSRFNHITYRWHRIFIADQGAKVTGHYNSNITTLEPLITEFGVQKFQALQADLSIEKDVASLFSQASASFGPVQSIVVNHAVWPSTDQPVVNMSLDQWKSTMDTNLTSSFLVSRGYLRNLETASDALKAYASIIFIGSTAGKFGKFLFL